MSLVKGGIAVAMVHHVKTVIDVDANRFLFRFLGLVEDFRIDFKLFWKISFPKYKSYYEVL